jgi:hypothetical protein
VFIGATSIQAAKIATLEGMARQNAASLEFLQAAQDRDEAVELTDWGIAHGKLSAHQRAAAIEIGATNPTRLAEWIALQPSPERPVEDSACTMMGVSREEFLAMRKQETGVGRSLNMGHTAVSVSPSSPNIEHAGMGAPQIMPKF